MCLAYDIDKMQAMSRINRFGLMPGGPSNPRDYPTSNESDDNFTPPEAASVNGGGIEAVIPRLTSGEGLVRMESVSHRANGAMQANNQVWEDIANKLLPPEESELMLKRFEKRADEKVRRTYMEGVMMPEVDEHAPVPRIGLTFLPGADKPQVTRLEQISMAGQEPEQKDAIWRVNTAASLLMQFSVSSDLSIVQSYQGDQTTMVASRVKNRLHKSKIDMQIPNTSTALLNMSALSLQQKQDRVTIDSSFVKIVNDLRIGEWDLESTLIEVDGSSITKLMVNFRHLISRGGPDMTFEETRVLLDTMIEDARRLCVRSPVLFRMSTRAKIINSCNTRYGINHGSMFRTLTTSQGIKEIISLSASYFNSLDPVGGKDTTQKLIRPRFLQMIVLLLSLLNDADLTEIADFLESTYKLKAERKHLELLFLKVIPLMSINSKVFLKAMIPAIEGFPLNDQYDDNHDHHGYCWDVFVRRILDLGYLLPGSVLDLGREEFSWIVKWPEDGFKSTAVFNNLQYAGSASRTINDIPPIEFHPEAALTELTTIMTNGDKYTIGSSDLDRITCLTPGIYSVLEAGPNGHSYDLVVNEHHINADLYDAIRKTNGIVRTLNFLSTYSRKGFKDRMFGRRGVNEITFLQECIGSGRITRSTACLNQAILAVAYKVEGRKIARRDAMRTMERDIREMNQLLGQIERRMTDISSQFPEKRRLREMLEEVKNHIIHSERGRHHIGQMEDINDEPISKVLYPGGIDPTSVDVWCDYKAWYKENDRRLYVQALKAVVKKVTWLSDADVEVELEGRAVKYFVTPLQSVEEGVRDDELRAGDIAILAGQYLIVAEIPEDVEEGKDELSMMNYLRLTSMEEQNSSRRRMNRTKKPDAKVLCVFR